MLSAAELRAEATRLISLSQFDVYDSGLPAWVSTDRREQLADLLIAVLELPHRPTPSLQWPIDLVSYVAVDDLPRLLIAAELAIRIRRPEPPDPALRKHDPRNPDFLRAIVRASIADRVPEGVAAAVTRQTTGSAAEVPVPPRFRSAQVPLAEPHHLTFSSQERVRVGANFKSFTYEHHPTWNLQGGVHVRFGARGGAISEARSISIPILRIEDLASLVPGSDFGPIELDLPVGVIFDCEYAFVAHDDRGAARTVRFQDGRAPNIDDAPAVVGCDARLARTPARFVAQSWGAANRRENLNRFGGAPTFIQGPEYPECPSCQVPMPFLMQLEDGLPCADGSSLSFSGIAYAYLCQGCRMTAWLNQM